jgi:serine/threonine-protein kinase
LALAAQASRGRDLYVYDGRRGTQSRLTFTGQGTSHPVWTPDAQHIVFKADAIRWIRADGRGEPQFLIDNKDVSRTPRSFSPDGRRLAYEESGRATGYDIWILPLDLTDPDHPKPGRPDLFLRTPFDEADPMFSPDGRWIAYWSNDSGRGEIYVRPSQGSSGASADRWQISTDGARYVFWSRNERELFYTAPDDRIMVVSYIVRGGIFTADRPRRWSDAQTRPQWTDWFQTLDLAPDGKRFAIFPRSESASENKGSLHVTFLLNFFDELRRRLPEGK